MWWAIQSEMVPKAASSLAAAEDMLLMMGFLKEARQQEISPLREKKIGRVDTSSDIDDYLIPGWVGHCSSLSELPRQLKGWHKLVP